MPTDAYLSDRCAQIESLIATAMQWESTDTKLGAHLAAYLSVLISRLVEDCVEYLVRIRVSRAGDQEVEQYVVTTVNQRFRNPDYGAISGLLKQFSPTYGHLFGLRIPHDGSESSALKSIIDNKNALAHQGVSKLQLTILDIEDYYRRVLPVLDALEDILVGSP